MTSFDEVFERLERIERNTEKLYQMLAEMRGERVRLDAAVINGFNTMVAYLKTRGDRIDARLDEAEAKLDQTKKDITKLDRISRQDSI